MAQTYDECHIFIKEIRRRHCLWDKEDAYYNNREYCDSAIEDVGKIFGVPAENVRKKWSTLRTQFRRELNKQISIRKTIPNAINAPTPWKYFVPLLFLRSQILKKRPILETEYIEDNDNIVFEIDDSPYDDYLTELDILESAYQEPSDNEVPMVPSFLNNQLTNDPFSEIQLESNKPTKSLAGLLEHFQKEIISLERDKMNAMDLSRTDDDILYLHSLLPYFKSLDKTKKFVLRTRIQQLVCDFIANEEASSSDHSYSVRK